MDDPDNLNSYWDSLPERTPEDDGRSFEPPVRSHLRVVDDEYEADAKPDRIVKATPFTWRPTAAIPKREWLYGRHLLRKFVSLDVAAGGVGKSSLKVGEALAMASGRDLYGKGLPEGALTVWMWNLEDPLDEIERRLHATAQRFRVTPEEISGRLYVDSGRDQPLVMATEGPDGAMIVRPVVDALIEEMIARKVDVLQIDPFISSHAVSENDNNAIDIVAREWNVVAERTGAAINLVHHVRKQNGESATADSARGASALIGKARSVLVYNRMTEDEAKTLCVDEQERRFFFRVDNDKANLAPPQAGDWYRMNNVDLENGDSVGVACAWSPPDLFEGMTSRHLYSVQKAISEGDWRENSQSKEWVGHPVAAALMLNPDDKKDRAKIVHFIKVWIAEGALEVVEKDDKKRMPRKHVVVGKWVEL
ncbi:AAA family ATPase [Sphingomonas metalli]|nr:AAA family ATPase [Sphingomonas metalli]